MAEYSKYNIVYRLQKWMDSVPGQTFLNYAYSWGASIVILGTLFKLTHLPGANIMLFIGMGTEVFVFFISAFDRPLDKTDDGKKIPTRVTEEYLETGKVTYNNIHEDDTEDEGDEQFMTSAPADNSSANVRQSDFGASMSPAASGTASGGSYEPAGPTPGMESPVGGMNPNAAESASAAGQGTAEQARRSHQTADGGYRKLADGYTGDGRCSGKICRRIEESYRAPRKSRRTERTSHSRL